MGYAGWKMADKTSASHLFAQSCECVLAAAVPEQFPPTQGKGVLPEVAFIGRSNVGKSSMINALTGRKSLARASNTPGRTQQIVFFNLGQRLMLVDLPGYGHAVAPDEVVNQWMGLVRVYLKKRNNLQLVCLLIDSRHGLMAHDLDMMQFLDRAAVSYQIVLTKADQLKQVEREPRLRQVTASLTKHPAARPNVLLTSAEKKIEIEPLRELLAGFALETK